MPARLVQFTANGGRCIDSRADSTLASDGTSSPQAAVDAVKANGLLAYAFAFLGQRFTKTQLRPAILITETCICLSNESPIWALHYELCVSIPELPYAYERPRSRILVRIAVIRRRAA